MERLRLDARPGWGALVIAGANFVLNIIERWGDIDFLVSDARDWFRYSDNLVDILLSPFFGLVVLVGGLAWLFVVSRTPNAPVDRKASPTKAWPLGVAVREIGDTVLGFLHGPRTGAKSRGKPDDGAAKTTPTQVPGKPRIKLGDTTINHLPVSMAGRPSDNLATIATVSFYNDPSTRTPDTNAHHARAEVTVFSERFEVVTKEHEAYWVAKTKGGGFTAIEPSLSQRSVDLLNSGQQRQLGLVLRFPREPVHFFASSAFTSSGSLHPSFALKSDRFFVRVRIFAEGVDGDEFWFHITQDSDGKMQITPIVKNDTSFAVDHEVRDDLNRPGFDGDSDH